MRPDQQAKAMRPYVIDMFNAIPAGTIVTFRREAETVTIIAPGVQVHGVRLDVFDYHFAHYKQTSLF